MRNKNVSSPNNAGAFVENIVNYGVMLFILVISLYPFLWVLISSFKTQIDIVESPLKLPTHLNLNSYELIFKYTPILTYFRNSIIVSFVATFINIFIISMAAYVVARFDFKAKNIIIALFSSTLFIPGIAISFPIFLMNKKLNLYDNLAGLIFTEAGLGLAVTFFILRSFIQSIPKEMDEAAFIDGAGKLKIFLKIILPLARPGITTAAILIFLSIWNDFYYPLLLTGSDKSRTLPVVIFNFTSQFSGNLSAMFASVIVIILPTIIIYSIASEQVVKCLVSGAVKG